VVAIPLACFTVVTIVTLLLPRSYASSAWFVPQSTDANRSRLAGIAQQFGVALPVSEQRESPAFYAELLQSQRLPAGGGRYSYSLVGGRRGAAGDPVEFYRVRRHPGAAAREGGQELKKGMSVTAIPPRGLVKLSVRARWAPLAQQIAQRLLDLVSEFNLHKRQSQATAERTFLEGRVVDARAELRPRRIRSRPSSEESGLIKTRLSLAFEYDRLSRELAMRQQLYASLSQSKEQAASKPCATRP